MKILVTGGCGFIGSNFIRLILSDRPEYRVLNLDALTYAGNLMNLTDLEKNPNYKFVFGSITDEDLVEKTIAGIDAIVNFAAESHVDRSLNGASRFVDTNVKGTAVLLDCAIRHKVSRFIQISTDEVYGSLSKEGIFTEASPLHPNNPYAATKAGAEQLVMAYVHTFGLNATITRSSNNYGPYQYPEKFIPLFITNAMEGKECPLYGSGENVRDWIHVEDNCRGILAVLERGVAGQIFNLGGGNEKHNLDVANEILRLVGNPHARIKSIQDRPGHDLRYALDSSKAHQVLGWKPATPFEDGLRKTVQWYRDHPMWVHHVESGEYRRYYERHYGK